MRILKTHVLLRLLNSYLVDSHLLNETKMNTSSKNYGDIHLKTSLKNRLLNVSQILQDF